MLQNETLWIKCNECYLEEDVSRNDAKNWQCKHCVNIPSDIELQKQLEELHLESHFKVPEELHGLNWFSFFDEEEANVKR